MKTILIVEDDKAHQQVIADILKGKWELKIASTISEAQSHLGNSKIDLVILDIGMPDGNGFDLAPLIKLIPVMFLTGRADSKNILQAFSVGAYDFLVKPYKPAELLSRVEALFERIRAPEQNELRMIGDLKLLYSEQKVYICKGRDQTELALTEEEFKILYFFSKHENILLNRKKIARAIWGEKTIVAEATVDSVIVNLHKKMKSSQVEIRTVSDQGYLLVSDRTQKRTG